MDAPLFAGEDVAQAALRRDFQRGARERLGEKPRVAHQIGHQPRRYGDRQLPAGRGARKGAEMRGAQAFGFERQVASAGEEIGATLASGLTLGIY